MDASCKDILDLLDNGNCCHASSSFFIDGVWYDDAEVALRFMFERKKEELQEIEVK